MDPLGLGPRPQPMEAVYTKSSVPQFRGNRLIEALPDYLTYSAKAIQEGLSSVPEPLESDASRKLRAMWLMDASDSLFMAEGRQLRLFEIIDLIIRTGYQRRNPDRPENAKYQSEAYKRQQSGDKVVAKFAKKHTEPITVAVIGCSGTGKSVAVEEILKLYPQVIRHPGSPTADPFDQVVYIKTECPPNGSVKSLCKSIIAEVDNATGLNYAALYRTARATEDDLKKAVSHILAMHRVGILVIDEIQNIVLSRKNRVELFNFIVSLANSLDVPILYIGTPKVRRFMQEDLRIARRFATWGTYSWEPIEFANGEWDSFYEKLCGLYALKDPLEKKKIEKTLFDLSQGIAGIMVNLFILAQMQAMVEGLKTLTVKALEETAALYFTHVFPMIDALRRGDTDALERYEDIRYTPENFRKDSGELNDKLDKIADACEDEPVVDQVATIAASIGKEYGEQFDKTPDKQNEASLQTATESA